MIGHDHDLVCPPSVPARGHPARDLVYLRITLSYRAVEDMLAERVLDRAGERLALLISW